MEAGRRVRRLPAIPALRRSAVAMGLSATGRLTPIAMLRGRSARGRVRGAVSCGALAVARAAPAAGGVRGGMTVVDAGAHRGIETGAQGV